MQFLFGSYLVTPKRKQDITIKQLVHLLHRKTALRPAGSLHLPFPEEATELP